MNKIKSTLGALLLLLSSQNIDAQDNSFALGLSSPCHGLIALRGIYDFNKTFGIQADIGLFSSIDCRIRKGNMYGYAGIFGVSPWTYALANKTPADLESPAFALDFGIGIESNPGKKGWNFGIEGGLLIPLPLPEEEQDTQAFRIDAYAMYRWAKE